MKNFFPDKEKDYQFAQEIPILSTPTNLTTLVVQNETGHKSLMPTENSAALSPIVKITQIKRTQKIVPRHRKRNEIVLIDLVSSSTGAKHILLKESMEKSWRIVGRALSRHSIEITDRNELKKVYSVQYDPNFKPMDDGSLWDEFLFVFTPNPAQEIEFRIKLLKDAALVGIIVLDKYNQPITQGSGLKLIELLYQTIRADLSPFIEK